MPTNINKLDPKQQAVLNNIIEYGQRINASDRVIQAAVNFANAESTFNPSDVSTTGKYKGLFQYDDKTWVGDFNDYIQKNPVDSLVFAKNDPLIVIINEEALKIPGNIHISAAVQG